MVNRGGHSLVSGASYNAAPRRRLAISHPGAAGLPTPFNALPRALAIVSFALLRNATGAVAGRKTWRSVALRREACFRSGEEDLNSFPRTEAADRGRN
jgi:hypothetical protein